MIEKKFRLMSLIPVFLALFQFSVHAAPSENSLPPILESKAYEQFKRRPVSDLSKLIYLIDRFGPSGAEIYYDGHYFKAPFAAWVAKAFLARNYKKESVQDWIMKWCHTSIGGELIYARFPDGKFRRSSEVLLEESKALEIALKK